MTETNRRIAEQFNEALNRGDLDAVASCFEEDCQNHGRKVGRAVSVGRDKDQLPGREADNAELCRGGRVGGRAMHL